ncbi:MAG: hypothetical protein NXY57DRAFT_453277 [Lentinula lateritia]|nr:MAG: hypothetical protein NXY57DRAFT_453277 [Lentinula lateritia]
MTLNTDVQSNWTNDPRAYGLGDWTDDPRAYGLGYSNPDIAIPLEDLDELQSSNTSSESGQFISLADSVSRNSKGMPLKGQAAPAGLVEKAQHDEELSSCGVASSTLPAVLDASTPSGSQKFPLSPPTLPVTIHPLDASSPTISIADEDEFPPSQLTQMARAMRPTPTPKPKTQRDKTVRKDPPIEILDDVESDDSTKSAKFQGKQREQYRSLAGPGPSTLAFAKRKWDQSISSSPSTSRSKQRLKNSHDSGNEENGSSSGSRSRTSSDFLRYHFHDSFLYLDASVIVRIGLTQFKLHRTLLAEYGVWFTERFQNGPDDRFGELPVYILDGVIEEPDFVNLLTAVKEAITYIDHPPDLQTLVSIFRAAHKLKFTRFEDWIKSLLEKMWPAQLDPLDAISIPAEPTPNRNKPRLSTRLSPSEATAVVLLARECGLQSVLKRALYELVRADGFGQTLGSSISVPGPCDQLSAEDHRLLVKARERLISLWMSVAAPSFPPCPLANTRTLVNDTRPACTACDPVQDTSVYSNVLHGIPSVSQPNTETLDLKSLFMTYTNDPLCGLEKLVKLPWEAPNTLDGPEGKGLDYCHSCAKVRRVFWETRRKEWWDVFGQIVGC